MSRIMLTEKATSKAYLFKSLLLHLILAGTIEMGNRVGLAGGKGGGKEAVVDRVHRGSCDGTLMYSDWSGGPPKVIKLHTQTCW